MLATTLLFTGAMSIWCARKHKLDAKKPQIRVQVLRDSFALVKEHAEFGKKFYDNVFKLAPAAQELFAHADMEQQQVKLVKALHAVVENVDKADSLNTTLQSLGMRHVAYHVVPEHYPIVGQALIQTFAEVLQDKFTADVKQAWSDAFTIISDVMIAAAKTVKAEAAKKEDAPAPAQSPAPTPNH